MTALVIALLAMFIPQATVDGLRSTVPALSDAAAREHAATALLASLATTTDPLMLLSIGNHEGDNKANAVGPESGGRVSCGVMTPEPQASCPPAMTLFDGYLAGARHLRTWINSTRSYWTALLGYAGGYYAIERCRHGPVWIRPGVDGCQTPRVFLTRALWIKTVIEAKTAKGGQS